MKHVASLFLFLIFFVQGCLTAPQITDALIVVDIDGTLGEQSLKTPEFSYSETVDLGNDKDGPFYLYDGALNFMRNLFKLSDDAQSRNKRVRIALFTMASGPRNKMIRDFIANKCGIDNATFAAYDYSNAVFSDELIARWRKDEADLSQGWKSYLISLEKPLQVEKLPPGVRYYKDLSKLVPFYDGLKAENVRLIDDNESAVPASQKHQHLIYGQSLRYDAALDLLNTFVDAISARS